MPDKSKNIFPGGFSDQYNLTNSVLGSGSYATVKIAIDKKTKNKIAVKIMEKKKLREKDKKKLQTEVEILKSLRHLHIVTVFKCYEESEKFYLAMERVKGGTLTDIMVRNKNNLNERQVRHFIRQLIDALTYMKRNGVIHRDIKPENILITEDHDVKLADFNLAKKIDPDRIEFSILETQCGTPNFVAPEILLEEPYDYKCDIWSLGVATYFMLSNNLPFSIRDGDETLSDLLDKVRGGKWIFAPKNKWDSVSESARYFVNSMLQKDPERRSNYDQLLKQPWLKKHEHETRRKKVDLRPILSEDLRRKLFSAGVIYEAATKVKDIIDETELIHPAIMRDSQGQGLSGSSTFNSSFI